MKKNNYYFSILLALCLLFKISSSFSQFSTTITGNYKTVIIKEKQIGSKILKSGYTEIKLDTNSTKDDSHELYATGTWLIPDQGYKAVSFTNNSFAPTDAIVTNVEYVFLIDDTGDPNNFYCGDYEVYLSSSQTSGTVYYDINVYDNLGTATDGGYDADLADDSDIDLDWNWPNTPRNTHYFDGEFANQYWGVIAKDIYAGDIGQLENLGFRIYWEETILDCIPSVEYIQVEASNVSFWGTTIVYLNNLNETFQVKLEGENEGSDDCPANLSYLTISFEQFTSSTDKSRITYNGNSSDLSMGKYWGNEVQGGDGFADYVMVEGTDNNGWTAGENNYFDMEIQPKSWGPFVIHFRMVIATNIYGSSYAWDPTSGVPDCIGEESYIITVNVQPANVAPNAPTFYTSGSTSIYPTKSYSIQVDYTDPDGASDLQNVYLRLAQNDNENTNRLTMKWDLSGSVYQLTDETQALTGMTATKTSITNGYRVTWNFKLKWNWVENTNVDYWAFSLDDANLESSHTKQNQNAVYENDIRIYSSDENNDPVTVGDNYTVTGLVRFEGATVYPDDWTGISVEMRKWTVNGTLLDTDNSVSGGYSVTWATQPIDVGTHDVYIVPRNTNHEPPNNSDIYWDLENVTIQPDLTQTRIKDGDIFIDKTAKYGIPILLEARLQKYETLLWWDLSGQTLDFKIYKNGSWQTIPDDGISSTSFVTNSNGIASVYFTATSSYSEGVYPIKAVYNGNSTYAPCELQKNLNINKPQWLFLVYLCADNNLEGNGCVDYFEEMWQARNNTEVSIVVLFDRIDGWSNYSPAWTSTYYMRMCANTSLFSDWSEQNMGDPSTLESFIDEATITDNCMADNIALIFWDHGSGWLPEVSINKNNDISITQQIRHIPQFNNHGISYPSTSLTESFCSDDTSGDELNLQEIRGILSLYDKFEIIGFDACLMSMTEVVYDMKQRCDFMVLSENTEGGDGWEYGPFLTSINNSTTTGQLANNIVSAGVDPPSGCNYRTLASWNIIGGQFDLFNQEIIDFADALISSLPYPGNKSMINICKNTAQSICPGNMFYYDRYMDLRYFALEIAANSSDPSLITKANAISNRIINTGFRSNWITDFPTEVGGISIYFPEDGDYNTAYTQNNVLLFTTNSNQKWDDFLIAFYDNNQPICTIISPNTGGWYNGNISISADASDPTTSILYVEFQYSIDHSNWYPLPGPDSPDGKDWYGANGWALTFKTTNTPVHGTINDNSVWVRSRAKDIAGNEGNWDECNASFGVDNSAPNQPSTTSNSHQLSTWSLDPTIDVSWSCTDNGPSGIQGYSYVWNQSPTVGPDETLEPAGTSTTSPSLSTANNWYFHIKAKDNAGNWGPPKNYGPFYIDVSNPGLPSISGCSHDLSTWSNDNTIQISWSCTDEGSGISGYSYEWNQNQTYNPDNTPEPAGTTMTSNALADADNWYFHIKAKDIVGSWGTALHKGPYYIDVTNPTGSITINNGAATTYSLLVTLTLPATDNKSGVGKMKLSNNGSVWTDWMTYQNPYSGWDLSQYGGNQGEGNKCVYVKYQDNATNQSATYSDCIDYQLTPPPVKINVRAYLQGPFNGTNMNNPLVTQPEFPLNQPYGNYPWNYSGTESVANIPANIVDWVLVELRDATTPENAKESTIIGRKAGFIKKDGYIVSTDGVNNMNFGSLIINNNLYVVVFQRNHLAIMSAFPMTLSGETYIYNFTNASNKAYGGTLAQRQIATGIWGMYSADGNADGQVNNYDKNDIWNVQAGSSGYRSGDFNMNANVDNNDKITYWSPNTGKSSQVPRNYPPIAAFTVNPASGTTSTVFNFDASGCTDPEDPVSALQVRWDWENDGTWDTQYTTTKTITHQYTQPDTYTVKLEVKDTGGLLGTVTHTVTVINQAPTVPSNPSPTNGAPNQPINVQVSWTCTDPENDPLTYDVYFGTSNPPALAASNQTAASYNPGSLSFNTTYYWKVIAKDNQTNSTAGPVWSFTTMTQPSWSCGQTLTVTHTAGNIAPVTKSVDYGTVLTTLTGSNKCWITRNLGASQQATSATDNTEASAGWYWQFNKQQGYKHDGITRTPNTPWNNIIDSISDWLLANDPCVLLLGTGWRLPTFTEWNNIDINGGWNNYNEAFASELKLHAAGVLQFGSGSLDLRGLAGVYWSSNQYSNNFGWHLAFESGYSSTSFSNKSHGMSSRCLRDIQSTWSCGQPLTVYHNTGEIAPVNKAVDYGTVQTSLSGSNKCWITRNLGASQQAASATDATEESAGWYWQFNRKQGYKHTGTICTPSWSTTPINEDVDWQSANDPCLLLLGSGWRIPTKTEWYNADANWESMTDVYNSVLKLHGAGYILWTTGALETRGSRGNYWSSTRNGFEYGYALYFYTGVSYIDYLLKVDGFPLRCLKD